MLKNLPTEEHYRGLVVRLLPFSLNGTLGSGVYCIIDLLYGHL